MTEPPVAKKPKRVIQIVEFERLSDYDSDAMITRSRMNVKKRSSDSRNIPFHSVVLPESKEEAVRQQYQVMIHDYIGEQHKSSFSDMFISGSHKYPEFFQGLRGILQTSNPDKSDRIDYKGLTMSWLNNVLAFLKHAEIKDVMVIKADSLRQTLTAQQIDDLPERFDAFTVPMDKSFVMIMDPAVIRIQCFRATSNTVRWKYMFHCTEFIRDQALPTKDDAMYANPPTSVMLAARRYEVDRTSLITGTTCRTLLEDPWPHKFLSMEPIPALSELIQFSLEEHGVVCIPLSHEHISKTTKLVGEYMNKLVRLPESLSMLDVDFVKNQMQQDKDFICRNSGQVGSRHIHVLTGRTFYGHYCLALKHLFKEIEFLVRSAFSEDGNVWATTAEIIIQA